MDLSQLPEWVPRWAFWLILAGLSVVAVSCVIALVIVLGRE